MAHSTEGGILLINTAARPKPTQPPKPIAGVVNGNVITKVGEVFVTLDGHTATVEGVYTKNPNPFVHYANLRVQHPNPEYHGLWSYSLNGLWRGREHQPDYPLHLQAAFEKKTNLTPQELLEAFKKGKSMQYRYKVWPPNQWIPYSPIWEIYKEIYEKPEDVALQMFSRIDLVWGVIP